MARVLGHQWAVVIRGEDGEEYAREISMDANEVLVAAAAAMKEVGVERVRVAQVEIVEEGWLK